MKLSPFSYTIAIVTVLAATYGVVTLTTTADRKNGFAGMTEVPDKLAAAQTRSALPGPITEVTSTPETQLQSSAVVRTGEDDHGDEASGDAHTDDDILGIIFAADYEPVYDEQGTFQGMRISALPEERLTEIPESKRLHNGDIITRINDVALIDEGSLVTAIRQFYWIEGKAVMMFVVDRNGVSVSVPLEMRH